MLPRVNSKQRSKEIISSVVYFTRKDSYRGALRYMLIKVLSPLSQASDSFDCDRDR